MRVAELTVRLEGMLTSLSPVDFSSTLHHAKDWIAKDTFDCFREGRTPDGTPWATLTPFTMARRRFPGKPILVQSGDLVNQVNQAIQQGQIDGNRLTIIVRNPFYALYHQLGTSKMPARPFLEITPGTRERVVQDAIAHITAILLGAGYVRA